MLKYGEGRGDISNDGDLKVLLPQEAIWVKVIALHTDMKEAVGILINVPVNEDYNWGQMVHIKEINPSELCVASKINNVPNGEGWSILATKQS